MKDYVLGVDASEDLEEIWEYIAADKIDAADRRIGKLFDAFEALARTPGIGHRRSDLTDYPSVVLALRGLPHYLSRRKSANPDRRHYAGLSRHPDLVCADV
jgi:plasmid stabilization system protein ParE